MIVLEFMAIISALFMEAVTLQTGSVKTLTNYLIKDKAAGLFKLRLFSAFILWIGSILYLIFAVSWCFSSSMVVQTSGLVLMALSLVSGFGFRIVGRVKPVWFV